MEVEHEVRNRFLLSNIGISLTKAMIFVLKKNQEDFFISKQKNQGGLGEGAIFGP
jgi:hypothetical protein